MVVLTATDILTQLPALLPCGSEKGVLVIIHLALQLMPLAVKSVRGSLLCLDLLPHSELSLLSFTELVF
jgi:hypothetical protein